MSFYGPSPWIVNYLNALSVEPMKHIRECVGSVLDVYDGFTGEIKVRIIHGSSWSIAGVTLSSFEVFNSGLYSVCVRLDLCPEFET